MKKSMPKLGPDGMPDVRRDQKMLRANVHPPARPPTRQIQMIRYKVDGVAFNCVSCRKKAGSLTCARCHAMKFCSRKCQKDHWFFHKYNCSRIKSMVDETLAAIDKITSVYEQDGEQKYLKSREVHKGLIDWINVDDPTYRPVNNVERYVMRRQELMMLYAEVGEGSLSPVAFRLAAENALDLYCMTYKHADGEACHKRVGGWMVAAGMNQEATNYFVYLNKRRLTDQRLPYLEMVDYDISDPDTMAIFLKKTNKDDMYTYSWFHFFMFGALLKYKKMQQELMERRMSVVRFSSFLMGTHPTVGANSPVLQLRGHPGLLKKIYKKVVSKSLAKKLANEPNVIAQCLRMVHERNPYIIPGLLDPASIPGKPVDSFVDVMKMNWGDPRCEDPQNARHAIGNYGAAWRMSPAYPKVLSNFLRTGKVTDKPWHTPMEGFLQTSVDVDPSKAYGDCSEFSLICFKSGSSVHIC